MKNRLLKKVLIGLVILFSTAGISQAGDNVSFSVSCTIPAIPGVNAPPFLEERTATPQVQQIVEQKAKEKPEETKAEAPAMIQEDNVAVKTIYPR